MTPRASSRITRRAALEGGALTALGIASAALIGCGGGDGGGGSSGGTGPAAGRIEGATSGGGLPMNAPVVQGKPRQGGTWTSTSTSTYKQHDPHTALGPNIFHIVSDKPLEPHPVTGEVLPHVLTKWEI